MGKRERALQRQAGRRAIQEKYQQDMERRSLEIHAAEPGVKLVFDFGYHATREDIESTRKKFDESDVYIPEGASPEIIDYYRQISAGRVRPESLPMMSNFPDYLRADLSMVYNSKKPILAVDIPPHSREYERWFQSYREWLGAISLLFNGQYDDAIGTASAASSKGALAVTEREKVIIRNLSQELKQVRRTYPELRDKQDLSVLVRFGAMHTRLFHGAKKAYPKSSRSFTSEPYIYSYHGEVLRRLHYRKEIPPELYGRGLLQDYFQPMLENRYKFGTDEQREIVTRRLFDYLTVEDIRRLSQLTKERLEALSQQDRRSQNQQTEAVLGALQEVLSQYGMRFPTTIEEFSAFFTE